MSKRNNPERQVFDRKTETEVAKKVNVKGRSPNQEEYLLTIEECVYTLCDGPAGSGKTHLALGKGIQYLKEEKFKKLILVRPLQECGRQVGFFPGDKNEKMAPHMYAFTELFGKFLTDGELTKYMREEKIVIDICEFMRGRTFDDAYIVVDEAQNCTIDQLKMLLTRVGKNSKMVIVGDKTQTDLWERSLIANRVPLAIVMDKLYDLDDPDIGISDLDETDIVRNGLIGKICKALVDVTSRPGLLSV